MNRTNLVEDLTLVPLPAWWESPWAIAGLVLVFLALLAAGYWLVTRVKSRTAPVVAAPPEPDRTPEFLARLAALRSRRAEMNPYQLAIACSDLLREFVEWRFRLGIRFQTTREFLVSAAQHPGLTAPQRETLGRYLGFCDLVKFARQGATESEQTHLLDAAEAFLQQSTVRPGVAESTPQR